MVRENIDVSKFVFRNINETNFGKRINEKMCGVACL